MSRLLTPLVLAHVGDELQNVTHIVSVSANPYPLLHLQISCHFYVESDLPVMILINTDRRCSLYTSVSS